MEKKTKIRKTTSKEIIEKFAKEIKDLEESGVEFATIVIDSYDNIRNKTRGKQDENKS